MVYKTIYKFKLGFLSYFLAAFISLAASSSYAINTDGDFLWRSPDTNESSTGPVYIEGYDLTTVATEWAARVVNPSYVQVVLDKCQPEIIWYGQWGHLACGFTALDKDGDEWPEAQDFHVVGCADMWANGYCVKDPSKPHIEKNIGDPCDCGADPVGNPINPGFGNKFQKEQDYGGVKLSFIRYYDSNLYKNTTLPVSSMLGVNWRHNFDKRLSAEDWADYNRIRVSRADGKIIRFIITDVSNNLLSSSADISDKLERKVDANGKLTGWEYSYDANKIDIFDTSGRLTAIVERNGYRQDLIYSDSSTDPAIAPVAGLLIKVIDSFNRQLTFTYDSQRRIITMTDPAAGISQYAYDGKNNLASIKRPDGAVRSYHYENANFPNALTGITDENSRRFATWSYDDQGHAISSEHGVGVERVSLNYNTDGTTIVTDALNTPRVYSFQTVQNVVKPIAQTESDQSSTNTTYDGNGNVSSKTDRNNNKTCYAYDLLRNLETARVEGLPGTADCAASLTSQTLAAPARRISTQWHPTYRLPTRIAEPKRVTTNTYDAKGNLLSMSVQASTDASGSQGLNATVVGTARTWSYTYNDVGQVLTATDPRGSVTTYSYDSQGNLITVTNALGQMMTLSNYDANGRVGRLTDPNGLVTDLTYSPRGWLTSRTVGGETTSYDYDAVGQLTKVTLPDGAALSFTHDDAHRLTDITDSLGNSIHYTLDNMSNRIKEEVKDPSGALARQTTRVYDALNRLQQITGGMQ